MPECLGIITKLMGGREGERKGERPIENIFYGQPTAVSSSRRNCAGPAAIVVVAQNERQSIFPLMNGLGDGMARPSRPCLACRRAKRVVQSTSVYNLRLLQNVNS